MQYIKLTTTPEKRFPTPYSTGYSTYAALLKTIQDYDETLSEDVHDRDFGGLHCSGILGERVNTNSNLNKHKDVIPGTEYTIHIGVTDPAVEDVFEAIATNAVVGDGEIPLSHGTMNIDRVSSRETTYEELLEEARSRDPEYINFDFKTPTCIIVGDEMTSMYPTPAVFNSLLNRWNRSVKANNKDELVFELTKDEIRDAVVEKPGEYHLNSASVLTNRVPKNNNERNNGEETELEPRFKQGFTGHAGFKFKDAAESTRTALTAVALFGEYAGVGAATARGCGHIEVDTQQ